MTCVCFIYNGNGKKKNKTVALSHDLLSCVSQYAVMMQKKKKSHDLVSSVLNGTAVETSVDTCKQQKKKTLHNILHSKTKQWVRLDIIVVLISCICVSLCVLAAGMYIIFNNNPLKCSPRHIISCK